MDHHCPPTSSTAPLNAREPLLSRDELTAFLVALVCAIACVALFLSFPMSAVAEEGDTSAPMLEEPEEPSEASGDGLGDAGEPETESPGDASDETVPSTSDDGALEANADGMDEGSPAIEDNEANMGEALSDEILGELSKGMMEGAPEASPAPSNPMPLIIVVAIMGVALAIAFVVSRAHAKPQKLGGTKGDVW